MSGWLTTVVREMPELVLPLLSGCGERKGSGGRAARSLGPTVVTERGS
jgi:hypothetical protein